MLEVRDSFILDGKPFKIISGSIHYFRTVPEYWRDRMEKLCNMGCNTVETYIPWNFHEAHEGHYVWDGMRDLPRFLDIARELNLYVILRPSPYICAEWEFGGLPAWLLRDRSMRLRCSYKPYLDAVERWYGELMPKIVPYQADRGGNVIMIQIENEYGYFGNDKEYLRFLADTMRKNGITVPFVTSDGPWNPYGFRAGGLDGVLRTGNFGSGAKEHFPRMQTVMGKDVPLMCMEFWNGWFDAWGDEAHHTTSAADCARELDDVLKDGSVNVYMFEGGTNFGFMSGRNAGSKNADVTSYDYDAALGEDGRITEKYEAMKAVIKKYRGDYAELPLSTSIKRVAYGKLGVQGRVSLRSALPRIAKSVKSSIPLSFEELDNPYGYVLYRTVLDKDEKVYECALDGAADRVIAYADGEKLFTAQGEELLTPFKAEQGTGREGAVLDFLVENIGRENFGMNIDGQRKGILGGIRVNGFRRFGVEQFCLPLDEKQVAALDFGSGEEAKEGESAFYKFIFEAQEIGDTYLSLEGWGKGVAFISGFNLGRFWEIGPQKTLYVPAPLIRKGRNEIVVFETEGKTSPFIELKDESCLG